MWSAVVPYAGNLDWLTANTILLVKAGSQAYGLATPASDLDVRGIAVPPREYYLGFVKQFEQADQRTPIDLVVFGVTKFFKLAADCNPNVVELLWSEPEDYLALSECGRWMIEARELFLSRVARHRFSGYAMSQLKRMRTHRRWLLTPPTEKPTRAGYGLPEGTVVPADVMGAIESIEKSAGDLLQFPAHVIEVYTRERRYQAALAEWGQYETWKKTRNPARAELEAKFGYDTKHAMHLVRLMRMCREILETGKLLVRRPDAEELLAVRRGAWSYEQLVEWAEQQDAEMEAVQQASPLPVKANRHALDALHMRIIEHVLQLRPAVTLHASDGI